MAGLNKCSKVKRSKGAIDAERGKFFSKLAKEIAVVAMLGGPHPDANVRLRSVMTTARTRNMPDDNIERAIMPDDNNNVLNVCSDFPFPAEVLESISGQN